MGVVTALGATPDAVFDAVLAGRTGASSVARWQDQGLRVTTASVVDRTPIAIPRGPSVLGDVELPWGSAMALPAARSAMEDAGLAAPLGAIPFVVANSIGAPGSYEPADKNWASIDPAAPMAFSRYAQGSLVAFLADALGATGPVRCLLSTCAAGNYALGTALDLVRHGHADVVLAGGFEEVSTMVFTAFHQLRAVSATNRPFDRERNGLMFGEGAAFLVVESEEHARYRGARVHAHLAGVGYANDAHNMVQPDQDGAGAAAALTAALEDAGVSAQEVVYVNAHGTGTEANDAAELKALRTVFDRPALLVSSTKSATGHLMAGASALEAVLTIKTIERSVVPGTVGLVHPIEDAGVSLPTAPVSVPVDVAVSAGYGFGGNDAAVVLAKTSVIADHTNRPVYVSRTFRQTEPLDVEAVLGKKGLRHADRGAVLWAAMLETAESFSTDGAVVGASYPGFPQVVGIMRDYQSGGAKNVNPMRVPFATANCAASYWLMRRGITGYSGASGAGECAGLDAVLAAIAHIASGRNDTLVAGGVEGFNPDLWQGMTNLGWHAFALREAAAGVLLTSERVDAWARVIAYASTFDRRDATRAAERAVAQVLERARLPLVDYIVTPRPLALETYANHVIVTGEQYGETLGASSALACVVAAELLRPSQRTTTRALVVSDSMDGYASALLLEAVEWLVA